MYTIHSKTGTPLTDFIAAEQASMKEHATSLTGILTALCEGGKTLHQMVNKAGLLGVEGVAGTENVQGEEQQKLDVLANDLFFELIANSQQSIKNLALVKQKSLSKKQDILKYFKAFSYNPFS